MEISIPKRRGRRREVNFAEGLKSEDMGIENVVHNYITRLLLLMNNRFMSGNSHLAEHCAIFRTRHCALSLNSLRVNRRGLVG